MLDDWYEFDAKVTETAGRKLIRLPSALSQALPSRGFNMADVVLDGAAARKAGLEPDGRNGHWFELPADMSKTITAGQRLPLKMKLAEIWPDPELPPDIERVLERDQLLGAWRSLTVRARWEWIRWIRATKNMETRQKRIGVALSKLLKGDRRPCCFNSASCTVPEVSKAGILIDAQALHKDEGIIHD